MLRQQQITRGFFADFVRAHPPLVRHCTVNLRFSTCNGKYINTLRHYTTAFKEHCKKFDGRLQRITPWSPSTSVVAEAGESTSVVAVVGDLAVTPFSKFQYSTCRTGTQFNPHASGIVPDAKRKRSRGAGRPHASAVFRQHFTMWWNVIRHSIDTSVMCRVPLCFLLSKARSMYNEYLITCTEGGV